MGPKDEKRKGKGRKERSIWAILSWSLMSRALSQAFSH